MKTSRMNIVLIVLAMFLSVHYGQAQSSSTMRTTTVAIKNIKSFIEKEFLCHGYFPFICTSLVAEADQLYFSSVESVINWGRATYLKLVKSVNEKEFLKNHDYHYVFTLSSEWLRIDFEFEYNDSDTYVLMTTNFLMKLGVYKINFNRLEAANPSVHSFVGRCFCSLTKRDFFDKEQKAFLDISDDDEGEIDLKSFPFLLNY